MGYNARDGEQLQPIPFGQVAQETLYPRVGSELTISRGMRESAMQSSYPLTLKILAIISKGKGETFPLFLRFVRRAFISTLGCRALHNSTKSEQKGGQKLDVHDILKRNKNGWRTTNLHLLDNRKNCCL